MKKETDARVEDPRFQRSLKALFGALRSLADVEPLAGISITRLVEAADVTRPTFYRHFEDIADLARKSALARLEAAFPPPEPLPQGFDFSSESLTDRIVADALPVLRHLHQLRTFYLHVLDGAGNVAFFEDIVAFVSSRMLPEPFDPAVERGSADTQDIMLTMAAGIMWLVILWLRDEYSCEPEAMAKRIATVVLAVIAPPPGSI